MHPLSLVLTGALASTLIGSPTAGPAPRGMRAMVCRGASNIDLRVDKAPSPYNDRYVRFVLRYQPGKQPVGSAFENLLPGHCSWNPNNWEGMPAEPGVIYIDIVKEAQDYAGGRADTTIKVAEQLADAITFPRYMKVPDHFWLFYVDDETHISNSHWAAKYTPGPMAIAERTVVVDSGGPAGKSTDRAGTSTLGTGSLRDASPTLDAARVPLTFREVVRKSTEYYFRFAARANANAEVRYSRNPPVRVGGRLRMTGALRVPVRLMEQRGFAAEYSTGPAKYLPMSTKYYFVIWVPEAGKDQPAQEYSGEFDTITQTVVVRFSRVHMLNDSDKTDAGDLAFTFHLTPASTTPCTTGDNCAEALGPVFWETGSDNPVNLPELRLDRAPNLIRIWVTGHDDDRPAQPTSPPRFGTPYASSGGSRHYADWNNARGQFDVGRLADNARLGFKLRSIDGFVLMYEVHGEIEVIRR
jgi:hypothetical protein